jgi:23S rRNA pseudouridine1911/1915/1917 synthase
MNLDPLRGKKYGVEHLLAAQTGLLETILRQQLQLEPKRTEFLLGLGSIYLKEQRCLENVQVTAGDYIRVHQEPRRFPVEVLIWPEARIFENEDILILNKPSGLPVHSTVDNIKENLRHLVSEKTGLSLHVTHRLDVATEGLLVFAKSKKAQSEFNILLMQGKVKKHYRALVHGVNIPVGEMIHFMEPSPRAPKKVSPTPELGWAQCTLIVVDQTAISADLSEVTIELITGRTHQIRAQLSKAGFPIVGDHAYGSPVSLAPYEKICLQAFDLSFSSEQGPLAFRLSPQSWKSQNSLD